MAQGDVQITVVGNLVGPPDLRFTPSGAAVAAFTVASTPRVLDKASGEWRDGDATFLDCKLWRDAAEHAAESLEKGSRVIVQGRLRQESWEDKQSGQKRSKLVVDVDEVGPSLRYATAKVQRMQRSNVGGAQSGQRPAQAPADPWATQGAQPDRGFGGQSGARDTEPPF